MGTARLQTRCHHLAKPAADIGAAPLGGEHEGRFEVLLALERRNARSSMPPIGCTLGVPALETSRTCTSPRSQIELVPPQVGQLGNAQPVAVR